YKPLTFFGIAGLALIVAGLIPGVTVIVEYLRTGLVPRLPSAVLAAGLISTGMLFIVAGVIVHTITRRFQELDYKLQLLNEEILEQAHKRVWPQHIAGAKTSRADREEISIHA